jgi:hypothetical protein
LDPIETAVRNAFKKGNPSDSAFRERVYRAAFAATERAIEANPGLTSEAAQSRRESVRTTIEQIESEFVPASLDPGPAPAVGQVASDMQAPAVEAETRAARAAPYVEPRLDPAVERHEDNGAISVDAAEVERRRANRRGGGFLSRLLSVAVVLLVAAAGLWWLMSNGFLEAPPEIADVQVPTEEEAPAEGAGDAPLLPQVEDSRDWITIFTPDDPASVVASGDASAEVMEDDSGRFIRIRSGAGGAPVSFDVGQGVLERIAGGRAVFDIVARAEEGMPTEIAVECDFGALGDCGRRRYAVNYERGDYLFEVDLPDGAPNGAGTIAVTSDVDGEGKAVDVYEIRVSAAE